MPTTVYPWEQPATNPDPLLWCWNCDLRVPQSTLLTCSQCHEQLCANCSTNSHEHNGEFCPECGFNMPSTWDTAECVTHQATYCMPHYESYHGNCDYGEYAAGDDGRYYRRPPVVGFGRDASLDMLDSEYRYHSLVSGTRAAALEIEAEYDGLSRPGTRLMLPEGVGICHDGSLSNGIEVTTPPAKGAYLVGMVTRTMDTMRDGGYIIKDSCGMHTHIDLRDKRNDTKFLAHLFNAFFAIEDILFAMQSRDRQDNSYSVPLRADYQFFDMYGQASGDFDYKFYKAAKTHDGHYQMQREKERKYASVRYAAFNFHSVYYRGSLECRIHEGSLNPVEALKWVDLLQSIIKRVEAGHSYKAMRRLVEMPVSTKKVRAMARYFGLTNTQVEYITDRINRGQGWSFALSAGVRYGVPVKGRPQRHEPRGRRSANMLYIGQRVQCRFCDHEWRLLSSQRYCPWCDRVLINSWGERNYMRAVTRRPRNDRRYATRVSEVNVPFDNLTDMFRETLNTSSTNAYYYAGVTTDNTERSE